MPKLPLVLLPLVLLSACATPREQCLSQANSQLRTLRALTNETRANIQRGYAISEEQEVRVRRGLCGYETEDGKDGFVRCDKTDVRDVSRPVAIDLEAERRKLASLESRLDEEQMRANRAAQICVQRYPAE